MSTERVLPTDWSVSTSSSDQTHMTDYTNALTNTDSTTYGTWYADMTIKESYLKFSSSSLPANVGVSAFKIKARCDGSSGVPSVKSTVVYDGTTYNSDSVSISATTPTVYDIPLPSGISPIQLKNVTAIYLTISCNAWVFAYVYGAELDIDTTAYKIFNLILPRG